MSEVTLHGKPIDIGDKVYLYIDSTPATVCGLDEKSSAMPIEVTDGFKRWWPTVEYIFWQPIDPAAIEAAKVKPKEPEYEWQWLIKKDDGTFSISAFRTYGPENSGSETYADDGSNAIWHSRIEESKREVKP